MKTPKVNPQIIQIHGDLIALVTVAARDANYLPTLEAKLRLVEQHGWDKLAQALRNVVKGERKTNTLGNLGAEGRAIVKAIVQSIADPSALAMDRLHRGHLLMQQGRHQEAEALFRQACALQPDSIDAHNLLGMALHNQRRFPEAGQAYTKSLELNPRQPPIRVNLGIVFHEQKRIDEAANQFERALDLNPDDLEAIAHLAYLREQTYQLDEAQSLVERGLALAPQKRALWLVKSKLLQRDGRLTEAVEALEQARQADMDSSLLGEIHARLGYLYDRLNDPDNAYRNFCAGNKVAARRHAQQGSDKNHYRRQMADIASLIEGVSPAEIPASQRLDGTDSPVFLVGFPRSGTTLLNQILDSHPRVQGMEEKPAVYSMVKHFMELTHGRPRQLVDVSDAEIDGLRQTYFDTVAQHIERRPDAILVDKFPLNIAFIPIMWRVFPDARYLLALRHPCDACLSCFMHTFEINSAMANFLTLEDSVSLYAELMKNWHSYTTRLGIEFQPVKYENLVTDFKDEATRLFDFLGVGWDEAVTKHTENARKRGLINTPSYDQITQPIYQHAAYRWLRYAEQFRPHLDAIRPHIESFGYPSP